MIILLSSADMHKNIIFKHNWILHHKVLWIKNTTLFQTGTKADQLTVSELADKCPNTCIDKEEETMEQQQQQWRHQPQLLQLLQPQHDIFICLEWKKCVSISFIWKQNKMCFILLEVSCWSFSNHICTLIFEIRRFER